MEFVDSIITVKLHINKNSNSICVTHVATRKHLNIIIQSNKTIPNIYNFYYLIGSLRKPLKSENSIIVRCIKEKICRRTIATLHWHAPKETKKICSNNIELDYFDENISI